MEEVFDWITWRAGADFDRIVLRYGADVEVLRLFNIDMDKTDKADGKITVPKSLIQRDGFFGFASRYSEIMEHEMDVSYEIDVMRGDRVQTIHLENTVTRPVIQVLDAKPDSIHISKSSPPPQPASISLKHSGTARSVIWSISSTLPLTADCRRAFI